MVDPLVQDVLWLPALLWEQMQADVNAHSPQEACGLVGGLQGRARDVFPVANILHSAVRFRMNPEEQVRIILELERRGWDLLAIYHSHPAGPPHPSPTDLAEATYPEVVNLIWYPEAGQWHCRGFLISENEFSEVKIRVVE